eukprot:GHUV01032520.1.p1 GENE.GHUV01032520.1~~GHUV01032520.1.p1  ORF type:complete len:161 (-),score=15.95 GHUV01032520.1:171-653(-)
MKVHKAVGRGTVRGLSFEVWQSGLLWHQPVCVPQGCVAHNRLSGSYLATTLELHTCCSAPWSLNDPSHMAVEQQLATVFAQAPDQCISNGLRTTPGPLQLGACANAYNAPSSGTCILLHYQLVASIHLPDLSHGVCQIVRGSLLTRHAPLTCYTKRKGVR